MARGLTGQTVLLAALLAALAGSQIALAQSDSDDDMLDVPVTVGPHQNQTTDAVDLNAHGSGGRTRRRRR